MSRLIQSFGGRLIIGVTAIQLLVAPALFYSILKFSAADQQSTFVNNSRSQAYLIAQLVSREKNKQQLGSFLDDLVLSGNVVYADYVLQDGSAVSAFQTAQSGLRFKEDFSFGEHGDDTYFIGLPIQGGNAAARGTLRLGYDETPLQFHMGKTQQNLIFVGAIYLGTMILVIMLFTRSLTKSIKRLQAASTQIAQGNTSSHLNIASNITEISELARDLEHMRVELIRREHEIAMREARQRAILETASEGIITITENCLIESINTAAETIFGYSAAELTGTSMCELLTPEGVEKFRTETHMPVLGIRQQFIGKRKSGETFHLLVSVSSVEVHGRRFYTVIAQDIDERHKFEKELEYLATHDVLTNLPNRMAFQNLLASLIATARLTNTLVAVLFVDLDRFKIINDTFGHSHGDILLKQVALRLRECIRADDIVARLGGDEFVLALSGFTRKDDAVNIAHKIVDSLLAPVDLNGQEVFVAASIGMSLYTDNHTDPDVLIKEADIAMYAAKLQGGNCLRVYDPAMSGDASERITLETKLRYALGRNEFDLHYQPQIDLATNRITGVEALLRWDSPDFGQVSPERFIPLLEENGLILPVGEWVLETACSQVRKWADMGLPAIKVAVNLSARQFRDNMLLDTIIGVLDKTGVAPAHLNLELTESTIMNNIEDVITTLKKLKQIGTVISVDDFGTGYSSLSYLKRFPIDILKVDKSFVREVPANAEATAITRAIISMAHNLHMTVIAEGIESLDQLSFLRRHGCEQGQGYHFSHPVPPEEITRLLHVDMPPA